MPAASTTQARDPAARRAMSPGCPTTGSPPSSPAPSPADAPPPHPATDPRRRAATDPPTAPGSPCWYACTPIEASAMSQNARAAKHLRETAQLDAERLHAGLGAACSGTTRTISTEATSVSTGEEHEHDAPVGDLQGELHRDRGGDHADAPGEEHPAVHGRQPLRRKPEHVGLDPGHQAPGHPEPDQGTAQRRGSDTLPAAANSKAPPAAMTQQGRVGAARSEAIEQQPERKLERREGQKVRAGEQPQLRGETSRSRRPGPGR